MLPGIENTVLMSYLGARELQQLLNVDTRSLSWNVVYTPPNRYTVYKKWYHMASKEEFLYLKDYAEENCLKFDEVTDFDSKEGTTHMYIMTNPDQTLLETCLASRKVWG